MSLRLSGLKFARHRYYLLSFCLVASLLTAFLVHISQHDAAAQGAVAQEIDQYAVSAAAFLGNPNPTSVTWVSTNDLAAESFLENGTVPSDTLGSFPVYALVVKGGGTFTINNAPVPHGASAPSGPVYLVILKQGTFARLGGGVDDAGAPVPDLSRLGTPETDLLSGIKPITAKQFEVKYHMSLGGGRPSR